MFRNGKLQSLMLGYTAGVTALVRVEAVLIFQQRLKYLEGYQKFSSHSWLRLIQGARFSVNHLLGSHEIFKRHLLYSR